MEKRMAVTGGILVLLVIFVFPCYGIDIPNITMQNMIRTLYVPFANSPNTYVVQILSDHGFEIIQQSYVPSDLTNYQLVILESYEASNRTAADYLKNYVQNGGGAIITSGCPNLLAGSSNLSYIRDWFGAGAYGNDGNYAYPLFDNPLETGLLTSDEVDYSWPPWAGAVYDLNPETIALSRWSYGGTHSFIHTFGQGRVFFYGNNPGQSEVRFYPEILQNNVLLFENGLLWAANYQQPPVNEAPVVNAGSDLTITLPETATLNGSAADDGMPNGTLAINWSAVSVPGTVTFSDPNAAVTTASFSLPGEYVLRLTGSDGELQSVDEVTVTVNPAPAPPNLKITNAKVIKPNLVEGEKTKIEVAVTNLGGQQSGMFWVRLGQIPKYADPITNPDDSSIYKYPFTHIDNLDPNETRTIEFDWDAVNIFNIDNNPLEIAILDPNTFSTITNYFLKKGDNFDYVVTVSPFDISSDAYSFRNWRFSPTDLNDLKGQIDFKLRHFFPYFGFPLIGLIQADLYPAIASGGHCLGMAATSILYYNNLLQKPIQNRTTFELLKEEARQDIIDNQVTQVPIVLKRLLADSGCPGYDVQLEDVYNEVKNYVKQPSQGYSPLIFPFNKHATVAYDAFDVSPTEKNIVIYDNNRPGTGSVIKIDLEKGTVTHSAEGYLQNVYNPEVPSLFPSLEIPILVKDYLVCQITKAWDIAVRILIFMSPVHIVITDEYGRTITDQNGGTNGIPGAKLEVDNLTGIKKFYLPISLNYDVQVQAFDSGKCTIIQLYPVSNDGAIVSGADIDLQSTTSANFRVISSTSEYRVFADEDGDGNPDYEIIPEAATIYPNNRDPVAEAGPNQGVAVGDNCVAAVTLNGMGSFDPDGDTLTYIWTGAFGTINGSTPTVNLPLGMHTITLTISDGKGGTASDSVHLEVKDMTPPRIVNLVADPPSLWPPNHKMVDVTVNYNTTDNCGQPTCQISSVTCNEPISSSDYTIVDGHHINLSADRLGSGNGRIYTITVTCTDATGNSSTQAVRVTVPHDQGKK